MNKQIRKVREMAWLEQAIRPETEKPKINPCHEQVLAMAKMMPSLWCLFAEQAREYQSETYTLEESAYIKQHVDRCGGPEAFPVKQCYQNAQTLLFHEHLRGERRFVYHEGYMLSAGGPLAVHHAWLTLNGKVVDPTADALRRGREVTRTEKFHYFGLPVKLEHVAAHQVMHQEYSGVTENRKMLEKVFGKAAMKRHFRRAKNWKIGQEVKLEVKDAA